jgi:putative transposase
LAVIVTYRFRLRDKHAALLNRQARAVNFVWNYANEVQRRAWKQSRRLPSAYDLGKLCAGTSKDLGLLAGSLDAVCAKLVQARVQNGRIGFRGRRSLGWVPFRGQWDVRFDGTTFKYMGHRLEPMHLRDGLPMGIVGPGSFAADARGRWYINVCVDVPEPHGPPNHRVAIGVDLGLKSLATLSTGDVIEAPQFYRKSETALATAQRARKSKRARSIHAKAANRRKDFLHKASRALVDQGFGLVVVGDVSAKKLSRTSMAKSVHDAGWYSFKQMLAYKAHWRGCSTYLEVNEAMSSQVCSACGCVPESRPKGIAGLGIREWTCSDCGTHHDRDVNAARNILRAGQRTLAEGTGARRAGAVTSLQYPQRPQRRVAVAAAS